MIKVYIKSHAFLPNFLFPIFLNPPDLATPLKLPYWLISMLYSTSFALLLLAANIVATATRMMPNRRAFHEETSSSRSTTGLPFPEYVYSQAAGLCQQTYCNENKAGLVIGDAELLYSYGDGNTIQRANIYHSWSLGVTLAYEGTNASSLTSDLHDVDFLSSLPDARLGVPIGSAVDSGFQSAWRASYPDVLNGLAKARASYPNSTLTVVGHSLGASQALLAGLALQKLYGVDMVVTCECGLILLANLKSSY